MTNILLSAEDLIGKTPLVEFSRIAKRFGLRARLLAKLEFLNPAGSIKDRVARAMVDDAERKGLLKPGGTIIEPTSGNTGIGLALVAAVRGYRLVIVMPDSMSVERIRIMKAYGAEVVLTPGAQGMRGAIEKAEELKASLPGSVVAGQFVNPANPAAHERTTGPEIWADTSGRVDFFVAGVGTGGTLTGAGRFLKSKNHALKVVAVEPATSAVLSGGEAGPHGLQGIGAGFVPEILDRSLIDEVFAVTDEEAYAASRLAGRVEGVLVGISSGAALHAAIELARRPENAGRNIAVVLPDTGDRYLSTPLFED